MNREDPRNGGPLPPPARRRASPRRGAGSKDAASSDAEASARGWESRPLAGDGEEIDPAELRDFLAADLVDDRADPAFKERLRSQLWEMVRRRFGSTTEDREA